MDFKQEISLKPKNPLNFRYIDTTPKAENSFASDDSQYHNRSMNRTNRGKRSPLMDEYNQRNFNTTLTKPDILKIIQDTDVEAKYNSDDSCSVKFLSA
jgi:hypothetical protein